MDILEKRKKREKNLKKISILIEKVERLLAENERLEVPFEKELRALEQEAWRAPLKRKRG